ncbi:DUF2339 domain-containing protein [Pelagibius sp. Alg239-R121]|uniref:DUF2339 domain-containing protein n=1 Tax=Pelagibius sp. Alg239-R121 TaxID=2993448 RepID=UPI0024A6BCA3|nr:DUF2339 domain-containing protein [Pelagibius sp. Alg239-R121]
MPETSFIVVSIACIGFIFVSCIATWFAISRTSELRQQVSDLNQRVGALAHALSEAGIANLELAVTPPPTAKTMPVESELPPPPVVPRETPSEIPKGIWTNKPVAPVGLPKEESQSAEAPESKETPADEPGAASPSLSESTSQDEHTDNQPHEPQAESPAQEQIAARGVAVDLGSSRSFEHDFGARLPVWIGGIAFALGGLFLVKYSIDNNLLSPLVRVLLGGLLGLGLLAGGDVIRKRPNFANGRRIAQSLSGAGIAVLYLAFYAATSLYQLISPALGFAGMAAVTATAIVLSLRHGKPIALLGLVFGFLTPALVQSNSPSALVLFAYLLLLFAGAMILMRRKDWWDLALPTLGASLGWAVIWIASSFGDDMLIVGLFLIAVAGLVAFFNQGHSPKTGSAWLPELDLRTAFGYLGLGGASFVMAAGVSFAGFGLTEWGLSALLALGGIYLAYIDDRQYRLVPWLSMAANAFLLLSWHQYDLATYCGTLMAFAAIYGGCGYGLLWRADKAVPWAGLSATASLGYYLLAYYKLHLAPVSQDTAVHSTFIWGSIALAFAAVAIYSVRAIQKHFSAEQQREYLLAIFAVAATAFVSLAMTVLLGEKNLPLAFAAEVLAVAWISRRAEISVLRPVTGILALVFAGLLVPQILLLVQLTAFSLIELKLPLQASVPIVEEPLIRLGLPALFFIGAAAFLRRKTDDTLVRGLEVAAIALGAVMGYYFTRQLLHVDENVLYVKAGFLERGIITNVLFLYGLFCLWAGRRFLRSAVSWSGIVLCGIALFRIGYFDLFLYNPIWSHQEIAGWPLLNALLLPFGLPIIWTLLAKRELALFGGIGQAGQWIRILKAVPLLLAFIWITLAVRQVFQGSFLDSFTAGNAEVYSYSVVWILFGVGLLSAGIATRDQTLRYASLGIMLLSVCKVFLYDTAELEGLYRVFSFFGLGISLLALSYVYTRFVFGGNDENSKPDQAAGESR